MGTIWSSTKRITFDSCKTFVGEDESVDEAFLAEYNKDIDDALAEYERGEYISQEEMEKKYLTH